MLAAQVISGSKATKAAAASPLAVPALVTDGVAVASLIGGYAGSRGALGLVASGALNMTAASIWAWVDGAWWHVETISDFSFTGTILRKLLTFASWPGATRIALACTLSAGTLAYTYYPIEAVE